MSVAARSGRGARRFDVLRVPGVAAFVRWRYARFALQLPLLLLAALAVYDGFTGRQIAPRNTATVAVWVHYRGLVALAIAFAGNLFCAACPLMLTRGPSRWLARVLPRRLAWPRALRNKWLVLGLTVAFLFAYEYFDLWASPWLTAWLILGYFAAALVVDAVFAPGTFCKYVCPLGNFNFALASSAPSRIAARDASVCESCEGKYCLNGREEMPEARVALSGRRAARAARPASSAPLGVFPGCETELFVPTIASNQDCTLCLNCVRACPYDNVALTLRSPADEAMLARPRLDWAWFLVVLAWGGILNAFAMTPPFHLVAARLSDALGTRNEAVLLAVLQLGGLAVGAGVTWLAARAAGGAGGGAGTVRDWAPVLAPLALAVWGGHYLYHFLTGYSTLWPNAVEAVARLGWPVTPPVVTVTVSRDAAFVWQVALSYVALMLALWSAFTRARRFGRVAGLVPVAALVVAFTALTILVFAQPMEARGSLLGL